MVLKLVVNKKMKIARIECDLSQEQLAKQCQQLKD